MRFNRIFLAAAVSVKMRLMAAAIEVYNKPGFPYRSESFTILAINGWELALKAKWLDLHRNDKRSLYVYEHKISLVNNLYGNYT